MLQIYKSEDRKECKERRLQILDTETKLAQWSLGCTWHDTGLKYTGYPATFSLNINPFRYPNYDYDWVGTPEGYCYPPNTGTEYHKHHWEYVGRQSIPIYNVWLNIGKACQFDVKDLCSIDLPTGWCVAMPVDLVYRIPIATHTRYLSLHRVMKKI